MEFVKWCRLQWDRALAVAAIVAGVVLVILGWIGVSDTPYIAKQVPFVVSYGIGGLVLIIIGATLWLSADMNDEWRTLDRLEEAQRANTVDRSELQALQERLRVLEARTGSQASPELSRTR
jgi:protein-S-isoprenylcysteine O-methyltransferase Ste14